MLCSIATKLDEGQLGEIRALEQELGMTVLAFGCHKVEPAEASDEQIARIKELESRLGVSLVAVAA